MNPRYLIVGPAWIGDMIMAQSVFKLLKQQFPSHQLDVLTPVWPKPVLNYMPEIDKEITLPFGHGQFDVLARWKLGRQLRNQYEKAFILPNSWKSALVPWAARIPKRRGWLGEGRWGLLNEVHYHRKQYVSQLEQFAGLVTEHLNFSELPKPQLIVSSEQQQKSCKKFEVNPNLPILILCPGAEHGVTKRWPTRHFARLASFYKNTSWQVILLGSPKEAALGEDIAHQNDHVINLIAKTNLHEAIHLLSLATAVVTNDSGLMHVAAALDRNLVAVYGSSSPRFTPPLSPKAKTLSLGLSCSPCFKKVCAYGHIKCLEDLSAENVRDALPG